MSLLVAVVVVSGVAIGYWLTSRFLASGDPPPEPREPSASEAGDEPARHWSEVLGVSADADATQISAAYRRVLAQYRPEAVQDMAPELQAVARARTAEVEAAFLEALRGLQR